MIDIIIPAYNAHSTMGRTLASIAKQINRDLLKVYIINDGSEKKYDYIIDNFSSLLDITEIEITNSGPGKARQVGIDSSKNEFIVFMDADDTLYDDNSILNLLSHISEADLVQGSFIEKTDSEPKVLEPQYCYLHGKMYRRSVIEKNNIKFDEKRRYEGDIYEDSTFNQLYTFYCNNVVNISEIVYVYEYNQNSITKSNVDYAKNLINFVDAMTWLAKEVKKRKLSKNYDIAWNFCIICFHIYFNYLMVYDKYDFDFKIMKDIKAVYNKFIAYLNFDEQLRIYNFFNYPVIPIISFYDFMKKE